MENKRFFTDLEREKCAMNTWQAPIRLLHTIKLRVKHPLKDHLPYKYILINNINIKLVQSISFSLIELTT
jgi:hypothetical protein